MPLRRVSGREDSRSPLSDQRGVSQVGFVPDRDMTRLFHQMDERKYRSNWLIVNVPRSNQRWYMTCSPEILLVWRRLDGLGPWSPLRKPAILADSTTSSCSLSGRTPVPAVCLCTSNKKKPWRRVDRAFLEGMCDPIQAFRKRSISRSNASRCCGTPESHHSGCANFTLILCMFS